jgi:alpha-L-fucosidase 2
MVFGGIAHERIQFNEQTVWTGEPHDYSHKGASQSLGKIRELLWAGKQKEAEDLAMKEFMSVPIGQRAYQALGDLLIETAGADNPTNYKRRLDLDTGIATTEFTAGGVQYRRASPAIRRTLWWSIYRPAGRAALLRSVIEERAPGSRRWRSFATCP